MTQTTPGALQRYSSWTLLAGVGAATAAAHIGNNFTSYLLGGLEDRYGFSRVQMGAFNTVETLSYALAMFCIAPRVARLSPRILMLIAGILVAAAQLGSIGLHEFTPLILGRVLSGVGFGLTNAALNLAAGRSSDPARAISAGIAIQTVFYTLINILLPHLGARYGLPGMFAALGTITLIFTLAAGWLPMRSPVVVEPQQANSRARLDSNGVRTLLAMGLFTFGSLAIWAFMERAAHAIAISSIEYGRYQAAATLLSALSNVALATVSSRLRMAPALACALVICGVSCAALTTVSSAWAFASALIVFNVSWFVSYPLLLGIAYAVDGSGRLSVLSSAVWLLMMSLGSMVTGFIAQWLGSYRVIGPLGMLFCFAAMATILPLARRRDLTNASSTSSAANLQKIGAH
jgi:hypothetical protein